MNYLKHLFLILIFSWIINSPTVAGDKVPQKHVQTHWKTTPSFKYDFLCLLNTLTGDPYYLAYYQQDYQAIMTNFQPSAEVQSALKRLKTQVKDENKNIISAYLCLLYSAVDAETLQELVAVTEEQHLLKEKFRKSAYYSDDNWALFEKIRPDLLVIMRFFIERNFEDYYQTQYRPLVDARIVAIDKNISSYNIIPVIEEHLGYALPSDTITVFMLNFSQPHGIKIIGTRFLTDLHWDFQVVFRNAVHEMMHPPFRKNKRINKIISDLRKDSLWSAAFSKRNPQNGYNSFEGLFDEGAVQALENHLNKKFGMGRNLKEYWAKQDGGLHVMAVCLYMAMQDWDFSKKNYTEFLHHFHKQVKRKGGLAYYYNQMYGT